MKGFELSESEVVRLKGLHRMLSRRQDADKVKAVLLLGTGWTQTTTFTFGNFMLDMSACQLTRRNKPVKLTRDTLLNHVWGYNAFVLPRSVDRCVTTLRNKIEPRPQNPQYLYTVRKFGYKFEASVEV